jgi:hypothetical protein
MIGLGGGGPGPNLRLFCAPNRGPIVRGRLDGLPTPAIGILRGLVGDDRLLDLAKLAANVCVRNHRPQSGGCGVPISIVSLGLRSWRRYGASISSSSGSFRMT